MTAMIINSTITVMMINNVSKLSSEPDTGVISAALLTFATSVAISMVVVVGMVVVVIVAGV